jgi:hypothetical protein
MESFLQCRADIERAGEQNADRLAEKVLADLAGKVAWRHPTASRAPAHGTNHPPTRSRTERNPMKKAEDYRAHSDECRLMAYRARSPEDKTMLMNMAATWESLAAYRQKRMVVSDKPAVGLDPH